ncbi:MAG: tetraacyldisaccharide 4'-kinase [Bacteroidales bacterium]
MEPARNPLLWPFSILFRLVTAIRNILYDTGFFSSEEFGIPVICIGNITVGGTGKTPHAEYIISLLQKEFSVALLSRGYMRKSTGFRYVTPSSSTADSGDEPLQISRKFPQIVVAVDSNRINGIKTILREHPGTNVIILDDGFQHRKVRPGLSILLTDYARLMTRDRLLPYGRLRESPSQRLRAGVIVVTKTPENITDAEKLAITNELLTGEKQKVFFSAIDYYGLQPVFEDADPVNLTSGGQDRTERAAIIVTGIASPDPLIKYLGKYFTEIRHQRFPDHHNFTGADIEKIRMAFKGMPFTEKMIITTEKDAVRFREFSNIAGSLKKNLYCIPAGVRFLNDDKLEFDKLILDYARKNK